MSILQVRELRLREPKWLVQDTHLSDGSSHLSIALPRDPEHSRLFLPVSLLAVLEVQPKGYLFQEASPDYLQWEVVSPLCKSQHTWGSILEHGVST